MDSPIISLRFPAGIGECVRHLLMRRMIDPSRFAEDVAAYPPFSKNLQQKTDAEAVEDWEDEGGAPRYAPERIVIDDLRLIPGNQIKEESKCT